METSHESDAERALRDARALRAEGPGRASPTVEPSEGTSPAAPEARRPEGPPAPRPRLLSEDAPPVLAEQTLVGLVTALVMATADTLHAVFEPSQQRVEALELAWSGLHLVALYLPLGLAVGWAVAALIALFRETPPLRGLRARIAEPRRLLRGDPELFAGGVGAVCALAFVVLSTREIHALLVSRVHRADLAAWAMGGLAVAVLAGAAVLWALTRVLVRPLAARVGRLASGGVLLLAAAGVGVYAAVTFLANDPEVLRAYGLARVVWGPLALLVYSTTALATRALLRRRQRGRAVVSRSVLGRWTPGAGRRLRAALWTLLAVALVLGAWSLSGMTYANKNRVRGVVEQRSVMGQLLVRRYAALTDMDEDGHAWAFGGRDCNDLDPSVHPGARDILGDDVDSDCFHGDGAPEMADLSDGAYGRRPAGLPPSPNILLVTIDALRPDHLGAAGYPRDTSPTIDRLAAEGVRFETVIAQSSRSIRSIPAMMTGHYPSQIAYGPEYLYPSLLPENATVAELLTAAGYQTAVTMGTDYFHRVGGFYQGFEDVQELPIYKPERTQAMDRGIAQVRRMAETGLPFFSWIHLFHVHAPYLRPPAPSRFGGTSIDGYDTEIRFADDEVARLLATLSDLGIADDTVVVIASDHGEAFSEHGVEGHSTTLYDEELRSTLIVRAPGVSPRVVSGSVALFDLAPTLLNLAGVPVPAPMPARSLLPAMTGEAEPEAERAIVSELMPDGLHPYDIKALRIGDEKLLWWVQDGTFQLFDLADDPSERRDRSDNRRDDALEMLGLLQAWVAQTNRAESRTDQYIAQNRLAAPPTEMTHPLGLTYPGLFTVLGCDLPRTRYHPGETIDLVCYYRVDGETELDLFFRVTFQPPTGYRLPEHFHALHYPLRSRYRSPDWRVGEILRDHTPMVVPPELDVPVSLRLNFAVAPRGRGILGFERAGGQARSVDIATITVAPR